MRLVFAANGLHGRAHTRTVHCHVDGTKLLYGGRHRRLHRGLISHVGLHKRRVVTQFSDNRQTLLFVQVQNHHLTAFGCDGLRCRVTQARCATSNNGNNIGNIHMLSLRYGAIRNL